VELTEREVLEIFQKSGALLSGHFRLSSGLHSSEYLQCALVLQYPDLAEKLCNQLASRLELRGSKIDAVGKSFVINSPPGLSFAGQRLMLWFLPLLEE
jgi:hypothetical protein